MNKLNSGKAALAALSLAALALAAPASAQTSLRADIPFSFVVGNQTLPAGMYNFVLASNLALSHVDAVSDGSMHMVRFGPGATREQSATADAGVVQFHKYGNRYFLSGVWKPGNADGLAATVSRRLIESAKAQGAVGETVNIDTEIK